MYSTISSKSGQLSIFPVNNNKSIHQDKMTVSIETQQTFGSEAYDVPQPGATVQLEEITKHQKFSTSTDTTTASIRISSREQNDSVLPVEISFSASGGLFMYQMGIVAYIQDHFDVSECFFSGCSGGSWAAVLLASGIPAREAWKIMRKAQEENLPNGYWFSGIGKYWKIIHQGGIELFAKYPDICQRIENRLSIAVTKFPSLKPERHTSWSNGEDIIRSVLSSALIPFAMSGGLYMKNRGEWYVDGGVTNFKGVDSDDYSTWNDLYFHTAKLTINAVKRTADLVSDYFMPSWTKPIAKMLHEVLPVLESTHNAIAPVKKEEEPNQEKRRLVITPWKWRVPCLLEFHVSVNPDESEKKFNIGYEDAKRNHEEIASFLPPKSVFNSVNVLI
jgi:hypothetical protein